jgi:hypothetical protein
VRTVRYDRVSLASGAVIAALGALVLLDSTDEVDLSLGWAAVVLTTAVGVILLVSGLMDHD